MANLEIKVRNGRLLQAMRDAGYYSGAALGRAAGISTGVACDMLTLKRPPLDSKGNLRPAALAVCVALKKAPEDLWPPAHMDRPMSRRRAELFCDLGDLEKLCGEDYRAADMLQGVEDKIDAEQAIKRLLASTNRRESKVIERRFGFEGAEATLREIGDELGFSKDRAAQIQEKALRKMKIRACKNRIKKDDYK